MPHPRIIMDDRWLIISGVELERTFAFSQFEKEFPNDERLVRERFKHWEENKLYIDCSPYFFNIYESRSNNSKERIFEVIPDEPLEMTFIYHYLKMTVMWLFDKCFHEVGRFSASIRVRVTDDECIEGRVRFFLQCIGGLIVLPSTKALNYLNLVDNICKNAKEGTVVHEVEITITDDD